MLRNLRIYLLGFLTLFVINLDISAGAEANAKVDFYGHELRIAYDYGFSTMKLNALSQTEFSNHIKSFRNKNLKSTLNNISEIKSIYNLGDVGLILLIDKFINQQFSTDRQNEKALIKYLILKELNYDVLLTRTGSSLNVLGNLSFTPGRYIYISYNNKVYKDLDFSKRSQKGKHYIFMDEKKTYGTINRNPLNLPRINARIQEKNLQFKHQSIDHEIKAISNQSIQEFLADLPMYSIGNEYTSLRMSTELRKSLVSYLRLQTQNMSKVETAQFLLAFVQQAIPYGSDYTKYGEERYYYPEQTVMASTADCEDKTFLLSYLAKEIAGINSVALYFENDEHLSIGLQIPDYSDSYSFKYKGNYYVACEPTAKTARLGLSSIDLSRVTKVTSL